MTCLSLLTLSVCVVGGAALALPPLPGNDVAETALSTAFLPAAPSKAPEAASALPAQASTPAQPNDQQLAQMAATAARVKAAADQAIAAQQASAKAAPVKVAAVQSASTKAKAAVVKPAAKQPTPEQLRQQAIRQAQQNASRGGRSVVVHSTAYNSLSSQTDASPNITATGTRTRFGTLALSRDLLRVFPYGTKVTLQDLGGGYDRVLAGRVFVVEDTMNPRIANTVDVWMPTRGQALQWGSRNVRITAVR